MRNFTKVENGMSDKVQVKKCADLLQAIAEPNRIRIIESLWDGSARKRRAVSSSTRSTQIISARQTAQPPTSTSAGAS
jgi:hypothetical protein